MKRLSGKVALVTGGQRGIGSAICQAFAREGAAVAIADVAHGESGQGLAAALLDAGHLAADFAVDVSDEDSVSELLAEVEARFGRVDVLVNNAGISRRVRFLEMTSADWDAMMAVNLRGVFLVTRRAVPLMQAAGGGRIINIASQLGQRGGAFLAHYCAAKAGVIGFTKALARELAPTITVNAIAPGPILTDMTSGREPEWYRELERELPLGRLGRPDEVAPSAVFLASDEGAFYTGQTLGPNGGHVML
jgi:3-oxoacyl-[acyl-carrier protein] reductase